NDDAAASLSPAVRKIVDDNNLDPSKITGTGKDGRLTKGDVLAYMEGGDTEAAPKAAPSPVAPAVVADQGAREERVRMTRLRQRMAERLKEAQNTAAMLTTFNEIDMTNCMEVHAQYIDSFEKRHGLTLGFMSFFVKACIQALK